MLFLKPRLRTRPHVTGYFCPPCPKKFTSTRSVLETFWPGHQKTLKRWKYHSNPHRACIMLVVVLWCMTSSYWKTSVFVRLHVVEKPAFSKISTLDSVLENMGFRWPFSPETCGRQATEEKISISSHKRRIREGGRGLKIEGQAFLW